MSMLSPRAVSSLEEAQLKAEFQEFVLFLCDSQKEALELSGIQTLISDALNIPDLEIARRWAKELLNRGQTPLEVARTVVKISPREAYVEAISAESYGNTIFEKESAHLCEATLYWKSVCQSHFVENRSLKSSYLANGRLVKLAFDIKALEDGYTAIRLDISNRPGAYLVERLCLLGDGGEQLWRWSGGRGDLTDMADIELVCSPEDRASGVSGFAVKGRDPQFKLMFDDDTLAQISESGGRLELIFRAFV